jgi:hypothetical protein
MLLTGARKPIKMIVLYLFPAKFVWKQFQIVPNLSFIKPEINKFAKQMFSPVSNLI